MRPGPRAIARAAAGAALATALLAGCGEGPLPDDAPGHAPEPPPVQPAAQALQGAHIPTLDPATLNGAEIRKVIGLRAHCAFRYTSAGRPVLVAGLQPDGSAGVGVVKLNGSLVPLEPLPAAGTIRPGAFALAAGPVRLAVAPYADAPVPGEPGAMVEAQMVFEVGQELRVGYGGFVACTPAPPAPAAQ